MVIPANQNAWRGPIDTGSGDDLIIMYNGRVYAQEGDDVIELLEHPDGCNCSLNGGSGSDLYIYKISNNKGRNVQITEDVSDPESVEDAKFSTLCCSCQTAYKLFFLCSANKLSASLSHQPGGLDLDFSSSRENGDPFIRWPRLHKGMSYTQLIDMLADAHR